MARKYFGSLFKIMLWGNALECREILKKMELNQDLYSDHIVGIINNYYEEAEHNIRGIPIYSSSDVGEIQFDYIIVASNVHSEEIRKIQKELSVEEYKILGVIEYEKNCYCRWKFRDYYKFKERLTKKIVAPVVYTAIIGNYDSLREPLFYDKNMQYVCFTNNKKIKSKIWQIIYVANDGLSDVRLARKIKLFPHKYLKDIPSSIWIDGKLQITGDLKEMINDYCVSSSILCFGHFSRNCIYDEAIACLNCNKVTKREVLPQIFSYYQLKLRSCETVQLFDLYHFLKK